jgi:lysozyme family protein
MAEFLSAQPYVMKNEGGYCEVHGDKGGETYMGISRNFFPNWKGWDIIDQHKPLTYNEIIPDTDLSSLVNQFYKKQFWDSSLLDGVDSQAVATYYYDFKVNAGANATKCIQRIVGVTPDGGFGQHTLEAVNGYDGDLLKQLHDARCAYYEEIAKNGSDKFLQGWLNRANSLYETLS